MRRNPISGRDTQQCVPAWSRRIPSWFRPVSCGVKHAPGVPCRTGTTIRCTLGMSRGEKLGDRLFRAGLEVLHAHRTSLVVEVMGAVCIKRNFMSRNMCLFENVFLPSAHKKSVVWWAQGRLWKKAEEQSVRGGRVFVVDKKSTVSVISTAVL